MCALNPDSANFNCQIHLKCVVQQCIHYTMTNLSSLYKSSISKRGSSVPCAFRLCTISINPILIRKIGLRLNLFTEQDNTETNKLYDLKDDDYSSGR